MKPPRHTVRVKKVRINFKISIKENKLVGINRVFLLHHFSGVKKRRVFFGSAAPDSWSWRLSVETR